MIANKLYILFIAVCFQCVSAASCAELEAAYLQVFEDRAQLLNGNRSVLKKSVYSYIPYSDDKTLDLGGLPSIVYEDVLRRCGGHYDVFYAGILPEISYHFLVIKNNRVFVWKPYLKIPGSSKKRYSEVELRWEIKCLEERLFEEKNADVLIELVKELKNLKSASWEVEEHSNPISTRAVNLIYKVLTGFWKLQVSDRGIDHSELFLLREFFMNSGPFSYYGLNSKIFGVSLWNYTVPGTPAIEVMALMDDLIDYGCDTTVQENEPDTYFDIGILEYYPLIKHFFN